MKIVIVSFLNEDVSQGPNWSVPARIQALEKIDDVLWLNCNECYLNHWGNTRCFHKLAEFGKLCLSVFPQEFRKPDCVIFEDFYHIEYVKFSKELIRKKIPYIIVPRGAMTQMAQKSKYIKKYIGNILLFNHFASHAQAIQYLTTKEKDDSGKKWNTNYIICPNGFATPGISKTHFSQQGLLAVTIGRLNTYHKGYDLLISAISQAREALSDAGFSLTIYGEKNRDYPELAKKVEDLHLAKIISFGGLISGKIKERVLLDADLFIMTSRFEGHPMGLIEALSYGVPCLVTPGTNMSTEIIQEDAGWTCACSVDSIADGLQRMIEEKKTLLEKSCNARRLATKYDWGLLAERFHDDLLNALK